MNIETVTFSTGPDFLAYLEARPSNRDEEERGVDEDGVFEVYFNQVRPENVQGVIEALREPVFLKHLPKLSALNLSGLGSPEVASCVASLLSSGRARERLGLDLGDNAIGDAGARMVAEALGSGCSPFGLRIVLGQNDIGDEGACRIAEALKSGMCPEGLYLSLWFNLIESDGARALADALSSGSCPVGLSLVLNHNHIGNDGARAFADALSSGHCPVWLRLDLGASNIGFVGACALACALATGQCPEELILELWGYYQWEQPIADAVATAFAVALSSGQCPARLSLNLGSNPIGDTGVVALAGVFASDRFPVDLILDLSETNIGNAGYQAIAEALEEAWLEGKLPRGLLNIQLPYKSPPDLLARIQGILDKNNQLHCVTSVQLAEQILKEKMKSDQYDQPAVSGLIAEFLLPNTWKKTVTNDQITRYRQLIAAKTNNRQLSQPDSGGKAKNQPN